MLIQEKEIRRIVQNEKEYRYGRFMDMKEYLERMTISYDENNQMCIRDRLKAGKTIINQS